MNRKEGKSHFAHSVNIFEQFPEHARLDENSRTAPFSGELFTT